jgi:hypothetical protein
MEQHGIVPSIELCFDIMKNCTKAIPKKKDHPDPAIERSFKSFKNSISNETRKISKFIWSVFESNYFTYKNSSFLTVYINYLKAIDQKEAAYQAIISTPKRACLTAPILNLAIDLFSEEKHIDKLTTIFHLGSHYVKKWPITLLQNYFKAFILTNNTDLARTVYKKSLELFPDNIPPFDVCIKTIHIPWTLSSSDHSSSSETDGSA